MRHARAGLTLVEVLVVIAVTGVLVGLTAAAVQRVRAVAARAACGNNLRQAALAVHSFAATGGPLPRGCDTPKAADREDAKRYAGLSWQAAVLPHLGEEATGAAAAAAFAENPRGDNWVLHNPVGMRAITVLRCPTEVLALNTHNGYGLTSYLGVAGTAVLREDGVMHRWLTVRLSDIVDGTSGTLMIGERPAVRHGGESEWYGNWGSTCCGAAQLLPAGLYARDVNYAVRCNLNTKSFAPGNPDDLCSLGHFWSRHPGGANFAFCDGSVRFLPYSDRKSVV